MLHVIWIIIIWSDTCDRKPPVIMRAALDECRLSPIIVVQLVASRGGHMIVTLDIKLSAYQKYLANFYAYSRLN